MENKTVIVTERKATGTAVAASYIIASIVLGIIIGNQVAAFVLLALLMGQIRDTGIWIAPRVKLALSAAAELIRSIRKTIG